MTSSRNPETTTLCLGWGGHLCPKSAANPRPKLGAETRRAAFPKPTQLEHGPLILRKSCLFISRLRVAPSFLALAMKHSWTAGQPSGTNTALTLDGLRIESQWRPFAAARPVLEAFSASVPQLRNGGYELTSWACYN